MHKSKLVTAVIDCQTEDLTEATRFWSAALGRKVAPSEEPAKDKYVTLGSGKPTPTRITIERTTDKGRLLTIVSDTPILFLGAGVPEAKSKAGYDFAVVDIEVDAKGSGAGTLAPAAKIVLKDGAFVVSDFASELVKLTAVSKTK